MAPGPSDARTAGARLRLHARSTPRSSPPRRQGLRRADGSGRSPPRRRWGRANPPTRPRAELRASLRSSFRPRRVRLVDIPLVQLDHVAFGVGEPDRPHARDEGAHVERAEVDLGVVAHLGQLGVKVVDQESQVPPALGGRAVLVRGWRRPLLRRGKELQVEVAALQHHDLARSRCVNAGTAKAKVLGVPALERERVLARDGEVGEGGRRHSGHPDRRLRAQHVDDLPGQQVAVRAGARGDQVAVDDDVLVHVDRAHVGRVAVEVVVDDHPAAAHQLRPRSDQPHAVADDALDHVRLRKRALQELGRRRQLGDVLGVAQAVADHARRHDDRGVGRELRVGDCLEAFRDLERHPRLVAEEGQLRLAPQATQEVNLGPFLGEAVLVVVDLGLVVVALDQDADLLAPELLIHLQLLVQERPERHRVVNGADVRDVAADDLEVVGADGVDGDAGSVGRLAVPDHRRLLPVDDDVLRVHQELRVALLEAADRPTEDGRADDVPRQLLVHLDGLVEEREPGVPVAAVDRLVIRVDDLARGPDHRAHRVAEPSMGFSSSTVYLRITALPDGARVTTHVWYASKPSHLLLASGGFQTFACQLTTTLTSLSPPLGFESTSFTVWISSKNLWVTSLYQPLKSSIPCSVASGKTMVRPSLASIGSRSSTGTWTSSARYQSRASLSTSWSVSAWIVVIVGFSFVTPASARGAMPSRR